MAVSPQVTQVISADQINRSFVARWKHKELFDRGFVVVPSEFLELYSLLNPPITSGEAVFIIQLMNFKWTEDAPFPGYRTLAKRMGLSDKAVRRHAAVLETKKYLRRIKRIGATNRFDLTPLFDALLKLKQSLKPQIKKTRGSKNG